MQESHSSQLKSNYSKMDITSKADPLMNNGKMFFKILQIELVYNWHSNWIGSKYARSPSAVIEKRQKFHSVMVWIGICSQLPNTSCFCWFSCQNQPSNVQLKVNTFKSVLHFWLEEYFWNAKRILQQNDFSANKKKKVQKW